MYYIQNTLEIYVLSAHRGKHLFVLVKRTIHLVNIYDGKFRHLLKLARN